MKEAETLLEKSDFFFEDKLGFEVGELSPQKKDDFEKKEIQKQFIQAKMLLSDLFIHMVCMRNYMQKIV